MPIEFLFSKKVVDQYFKQLTALQNPYGTEETQPASFYYKYESKDLSNKGKNNFAESTSTEEFTADDFANFKPLLDEIVKHIEDFDESKKSKESKESQLHKKCSLNVSQETS